MLADVSFWTRATMIEGIVGPFFGFDLWCRGCKCLEQQADVCTDASVGKAAPKRTCRGGECLGKGCRGPELAQKVVDMCDHAMQNTDLFRAEHAEAAGMVDESPVLHVESVALLRAKFAWLGDVPWYTWQVNYAERAGVFLQKCDADLSAGRPLHRVTGLLGGRSSVWRPMMQSWASGGRPSPELLADSWRYHTVKQTTLSR